MKPLYILKIGGSVVTQKSRVGTAIRKKLLAQAAKEIASVRKEHDFDLVMIHGAGSTGHQIAKKYRLADGARNDEKKWEGCLLCRAANQRMNAVITESLRSGGLPITPVHTASCIIHKDKKIIHCDYDIIRIALSKKCIPLLYGEVVFDNTLGMSICSGDNIAVDLANHFGAKKIMFASDIDGVFDADPHTDKNATLLERLVLKKIHLQSRLSGSHNVDVTGGLGGKVKTLDEIKNKKTRTVEIFNGLKTDNFKKIFLNKEFPHTVIKI